MNRSYSITKDSDELKKLIEENPELPIVVLAGEDATDGDHSWMYCSCISFSVDEILDCDYLDYGDTVFTDRDRLHNQRAERVPLPRLRTPGDDTGHRRRVFKRTSMV